MALNDLQCIHILVHTCLLSVDCTYWLPDRDKNTGGAVRCYFWELAMKELWLLFWKCSLSLSPKLLSLEKPAAMLGGSHMESPGDEQHRLAKTHVSKLEEKYSISQALRWDHRHGWNWAAASLETSSLRHWTKPHPDPWPAENVNEEYLLFKAAKIWCDLLYSNR